MKLKSLLSATSALLITASSCFAGAKVGEAAPEFTLKDTSGKEVSLTDYAGKTVVLEWLNYDCPFVKKFYSGGDMQKLQSAYTGKDVVWLSVHSAHEGHSTYLAPSALGERASKEGSKATSVLVDASGTTGKSYGAKTTPHLFVIDKKGTLVYAGGIDSIKSTKSEDIEKAEPFLANALDEIIAGSPVTKASTAPYGCGVKYKN